MSDPLSQEFVVSFLTVCFDEGLSKEAAAELLQRATVVQEFAERPAFAEGYLAIASQVPGQLLPLRAGYEELEKLAARSRAAQGVVNLAKRVWGAGGDLKDIVAGTGSAAKTGVGKVRRSPVLTKNPFGSALVASGATGVGVYGVGEWSNRDRSFTPSRTSPFFTPGSYSPQGYQDNYDAQLDSYRPGIYGHNKEHFGSEGRRRELEKAVADGTGGTEAYHELQILNKGHAESSKARDRHLHSLEADEANNSQLVDRIAKRTQSLENQRGAWWAAPWRRGKGRQDFYDQKIADLHGNRAHAKREADLAADRKRLLWAGATEDRETTQPTRQEIQQRFFPRF